MNNQKSTKQKPAEYKVLATKYRPDNFDDLIGQDVLVRTISNAIQSNRIANAFVLTGIRGVGKTTTARIIARSLNCVGKDGTGGATITPCNICNNCVSIKEDRHPDVIEIDAASHTGIDDIREIIENSRYLPTSARYKIYIIVNRFFTENFLYFYFHKIFLAFLETSNLVKKRNTFLKRNIQSAWFGIEVFNLLGVNNTISWFIPSVSCL